MKKLTGHGRWAAEAVMVVPVEEPVEPVEGGRTGKTIKKVLARLKRSLLKTKEKTSVPVISLFAVR